MVSNEKTFPRGGIANLAKNVDDPSSNIVFGATQRRIKKTVKRKEKDVNTEQKDQLQAFSAETLTYDTLQEHMLVMGVVKATDATSIQIALPGRMTARALVADISDAYGRVAQSYMAGDTSEYKDLTVLFTVGQIVYGRAIKTEKPNNRMALLLTLKPAEINSNLHHGNIKKGFIFMGAIEEIQEHGCVIETGINGLQAFVPIANAAEHHHIGQLIFLKVKQIQHDSEKSTCQCAHLDQKNLKIKSQNETNLDYILPGSIVKLKVTKHLKNGLEGTMMNEAFRGYVNEHHLAEALVKPEDYELNEEYFARVLYVMPLTKLVYLTFNLDIAVTPEVLESEGEDQGQLKKGAIVEKARVLRHGTGGIILLLNKKYKGLISYSSIKSNFKGNYDQDVVLSKYSSKSKHKVRVLGYDVIESLYYCSDDPNVLNEKTYTIEDIHAGDIVSARIVKSETKIGGYCVKIGKVNGIIEELQLAPNTRYEVGQSLRCRVLDVCLDRKICYLSNRNDYLNKGVKLLTSLDLAKPGSIFTGTVVKCEPSYVLVKFCSGIKGVLHKQRLNELLESTFFAGQTTKFRIAGRNNEQILLTLPEDKFNLGEIIPIEVTNVLDAGLEIKITCSSDDHEASTGDEENIEEFVGLVPLPLLSDYVDLQDAQKRVNPAGTRTEAACIMQNIFSLRDVPYFSENITKDWNTVQVGDVLRAHVKHVGDQVLELLLPVRNYNKLVKLHVKMLCLQNARDTPIVLEPDQLLYVKVIGKEAETKTLTVSAKLTDVWSGQLSDTAKLVESYLEELAQIRKSLKSVGAPIAKFEIGEKVNVIFKGIDSVTNNWIYNLEGSKSVTAMMVASISGPAIAPKLGSKQEAVILWIDYGNNILLISNKKVDVEHIRPSRELPKNLVGKAGMKAKVLLKLDSIVVCSLKKGNNNPLIVCPIRLHPNDVENTASACLRQGDFCNLALIHEGLPIAVPETVWKLWKGVKRTSVETEDATVKLKKMRLDSKAEKKTRPESIPNGKTAEKIQTSIGKATNGKLFFEDKKPAKTVKYKWDAENEKAAKARLPGIFNFWDADVSTLNGKDQVEISSDEDDDNTTAELEARSAKKRRLSAKEKAKAEAKEEKRLREIEERNADPSQCPETIDEFERLVLAEPNNSKSWIQYMSFLLSNTEIDKARDIARRAIKTIAFRETKELRNVWTALLNLELSYNSANFDDVLKEAVSHTDPLETYLNLVEVLKSHNERERLVNTLNIIMRKFRTELQVWKVVADAYFWLGMSDRVQPTLQRAISVLPKNQHINCIVAFAKLYAQNNDNAMAQTLLDDIVTSYPKRIDIWVLYVDMLIKSDLIDSARNVLERAVLQKLQPEKMLVIYKKYMDFELKYGSETSAVRVKQLAEQYVQSQNKAKTH